MQQHKSQNAGWLGAQITKSQRSMLGRRQSIVRAKLLNPTMQMLCARLHLQRAGLPTAALPCLPSCN